MSLINTDLFKTDKRLGGQPSKGHPLMLNAVDYITTTMPIPATFKYWRKRKSFPVFDTGNSEEGCCTRAKQAVFQMYMERQEQRKTTHVTKDEILRVYHEMSDRLYGGGDNGAYEIDALNCWRNKDYTFRDTKGRPMIIQGYSKINHSNIDEVKRCMMLAGSKGIAVCFALPAAWAGREDQVWDIPAGQAITGEYAVGTWGYHSTVVIADWDEKYVTVPSTWNVPDGKISWEAFSIYASEAYLVIDSFNWWKTRVNTKQIDLNAMISDINNISTIKVK